MSADAIEYIDVSSPPEIVTISDYDEVGEGLRCPHLTTRMIGPLYEPFHQGHVNQLDGPAHSTRRRALGQLLRRRGHKYFRDTFLFPTADSALARVLRDPDPDGWCRMELVGWSRLVNQRLGAAYVGFDAATSEEGAERLYEIMQVFLRGRASSLEVATGTYHADGAQAQAAIEARDTMIAEFYEPAYARRVALWNQVQAGELDESELPQDILMLNVRKVDPAWNVAADAHREAIATLGASVRTTTHALKVTLLELFEWLEANPGNEALLEDDQFLARAAQEALRLHAPIAAIPRGALQDVELGHGTQVARDTVAVFDLRASSVSPGAFGDDAASFNPNREVEKGTNRYGYAFGAGAHTCIGLPIVMGSDGLDGSLVYLLKILLRAGVRADPAFPSLAEDLVRERGVMTADRLREAELHLMFPPAAER